MIKEKIGIMGGTFDPPHIAHISMAGCVMDALMLDRVIFVPTGKIKYKSSINSASPIDRLNMISIAIEGNPQFEVSATEVERDSYTYTYTCDTLEVIQKDNPEAELFFIVGADSLDYMDKWKNPGEIFRSCTVAAVGRKGFDENRMLKKKAELEEKFSGEIVLVHMPLIEVSSTDIRERIYAGDDVGATIDSKVAEYIKQNGLYSAKDSKRYD